MKFFFIYLKLLGYVWFLRSERKNVRKRKKIKKKIEAKKKN